MNGYRGWVLRVGTAGGYRGWVPRMDTADGFCGWVPRVGTTDGYHEWILRIGTSGEYCGWVPRVGALIVENIAHSAVNSDLVTVFSFKLVIGQNRALRNWSSAGNFSCQ